MVNHNEIYISPKIDYVSQSKQYEMLVQYDTTHYTICIIVCVFKVTIHSSNSRDAFLLYA